MKNTNETFRFMAGIALVSLLSTGTAQAQIVITPSAAADNGGSLSSRGAGKTIDGSGLLYYNDTINTIIDDWHSGVRNHQWTATRAGQALRLTFPEAVDIDRVYLWNEIEINARGIQTCDFLFSTDGGSSYANATNLSFAQGGSTAQTRTFAMQTGVTHIMLTNLVNYGDATYIALAELRFGRPLPTGQMQWHDWRVPATTNAITRDTVQLSAILAGTNASVTLYWEAGAVADPATHTGWDGSSGPASVNTGTIMRTASNLQEGPQYSYAFYATNSTHATEAWTGVGTFTTLEGEVVAEYLFDANSPASSDEHINATASNIVLGAGISTSLRNNRIECTGADVEILNLAGTDYFEFTLSIPANVTLSLTRFTYTYAEVNAYEPAHALWSNLIGAGGGEITTPATRYTPVLRNTGLNGIRTIVHNLTEAGSTFADLSGTNITFRLYMGDGATGTTVEQRFDDIRLYAIDPTPPAGTIVIIR